MGLFDFLPCCGRRADKGNAAETDPLIAPYREGSITSQDAYGAVSMSASTTMDGSHVAGGATGTLSTSAKERIDKIGREVGGNMLSINTTSRSALRMQRPPSPTDSAGSTSRPPTPSPRRPGPEGGVMSPPPTASTIATNDDNESVSADASSTQESTGDVVHKTLFHGAPPRGKGGKPKKNKGKSARAKSKKQK